MACVARDVCRLAPERNLFHMALAIPWRRGSLNPCFSLSAGFHKVMEGIHKAIELGYKPVKVRAVTPADSCLPS